MQMTVMRPFTPSRSSRLLLGVVILLFVIASFVFGWIRMGSNQPPSVPGKFRSFSSASPNPTEFIVFGDNGSGLPGQFETAAEMGRAYQAHPFSFALMLGDNIYPDGNTDRFGKSRFLVPYKVLLDNGVQFFPSLGNHDIAGHHVKTNMAFFKMPGPYYDFVYNNIHFFALNTTNFDMPQRNWLYKRLKAAQEPWKIVYGHHPIFSSGFHRSNPKLKQDLLPILESFHADLYLAGHDHDYERFSPIHGVMFIVSGGGGAVLRPFHHVEQHSVVRISDHHFLRFSVTPTGLSYQAIDRKGHIIDSDTIKKPAA